MNDAKTAHQCKSFEEWSQEMPDEAPRLEIIAATAGCGLKKKNRPLQ